MNQLMTHDSAVRILVVDDRPDSTRTLRGLIHPRKIHVTSVSTAEEALERLDHQVFDVALVGAALVERGAAPLLELMRRVQPLLQVVVLTEDVAGRQAAADLKHGAFAVVARTERPALLAAKILNAHSVRRFHVQNLGAGGGQSDQLPNPSTRRSRAGI
jgi:DNA-binding NtrC family response regulator